jgi:hypothetical protein
LVSASRSTGEWINEQEGAICSASPLSRRQRLLDQVECPLQIRTPDVAAIQHAKREQPVRRQCLEKSVQLAAPTDEVRMMAGNGKIGRHGDVVAVFAEIVGQHDLRRGQDKLTIGKPQSALLGLREVERQHWLVELHPLCPRRLETAQ